MSDELVKARTNETPFCEIPVNESHLMKVAAGIDAIHALGTADALSAYVQERLFRGVSDADGINAKECFALDFLLEASRAIRASLGVRA